MSTNPDWIQPLAVGVGIGVVIGWLIRGRWRRFYPAMRGQTKTNEVDLTDNGLAMCDDGEYKMVIVVRTDLKMGKGKVAAQCAHGALAAAEKCFSKDQTTFLEWRNSGQPKVVVKTDTAESLKQLSKEAASRGLICSIISDAGRTQIPSGSKTVLAVGPGPARLIDSVTGHLKLY